MFVAKPSILSLGTRCINFHGQRYETVPIIFVVSFENSRSADYGPALRLFAWTTDRVSNVL
jgi:hypothetical protein